MPALIPIAIALLTAAAAHAQDLKPEVLLLARVKQHMRSVLERQPNYTCLETIERSNRRARSKRFELQDALRLEVAVVDGKELFSWPGEREFKDRDLRELAPTGAISNGSFAIHSRSVFMSGTANITYWGREALDGRELSRFDYAVPQFRSGYLVRMGSLEGIVGYHGSFWVDDKTLDVARLDVHAAEIPPHLPLKETTDVMFFDRIPIGASTFLLPKSAELIFTDLKGNQNRNHLTFSGCRQYSGESTLSFDEPPAGPAPSAPTGPILLPEDLDIEIQLLTRLQIGKTMIGEEIEGRVARPAKRKGQVLVPKGATLKGNVALIEKRPNGFVVSLHWREIEFDQRTGVFEADLVEGAALRDPRTTSGGYLYVLAPWEASDSPPRRNVFYVRKTGFDIPRGFPMLWRTRGSAAAGAKSK